jgi:hypothetical protein
MGRVLCVTDHVPSSHSRGGALKLADATLYLIGVRRSMGGCSLVVDVVDGIDVRFASAMILVVQNRG